MRNALIEGGIETIGEINNPFRQHVRYGEKEGEAGYQTFFIQNYEPLPTFSSAAPPIWPRS